MDKAYIIFYAAEERLSGMRRPDRKNPRSRSATGVIGKIYGLGERMNPYKVLGIYLKNHGRFFIQMKFETLAGIVCAYTMHMKSPRSIARR